MYVRLYLYIHIYIYLYKYYSAINENEISLFETTWMYLLGIMLTEISQTETQMPYGLVYMWNLKYKTKDWTKQNRNRLTDTENKLLVTKGEGSREM